MPKIPRILASGQTGVLALPAPTPQAFGAEGFASLTRFGEHLGQQAEKLQQTQDELDVIGLAGEYETGLAEIRTGLTGEPDALQHDRLFTERAQALQRSLEARAKRPVVAQAFRAHVGRTFPRELVEVRTAALKRLAERQLADLDRLEEDTSRKAADALVSGFEQARQSQIATFTSEADRYLRRGLLTAVQHQDRLQHFRQKTLEKEMEILRRTDRAQLREMDRAGAFADLDAVTRLKILDAARADEEREDRRHEAAFKTAQDAVERHWSAQANQGLLRDADLEAALKGEDPFITPDKARQFQVINASPPTGEGSLHVRAIMEDYHAGPSSQARIEAARQSLNHLRRGLGRPNPLIDTALNELQTDERTGRTVRAAELAAGIKVAEDTYRSRSSASLLGPIGQIKDRQDLAGIRNRIRRAQEQGKDPMAEAQTIVDEYLKRRESAAEQVPERTKRVLELDK